MQFTPPCLVSFQGSVSTVASSSVLIIYPPYIAVRTRDEHIFCGVTPSSVDCAERFNSVLFCPAHPRVARKRCYRTSWRMYPGFGSGCMCYWLFAVSLRLSRGNEQGRNVPNLPFLLFCLFFQWFSPRVLPNNANPFHFFNAHPLIAGNCFDGSTGRRPLPDRHLWRAH